MEHHLTCSPPPAPIAPAAPATPDRAHWTPAKQRAFLYELLETGSVAPAARAVGMSRSSAHRLRARLAGTLFDGAWGHALQLHAEQLADPFGADGAAPDASPADDDGDPAAWEDR